jgi:hypothetical protein
MNKVRAALMTVLAGSTILLGGTAAGATTLKQATHAGQASPNLMTGLPPGYVVVNSAPMDAPSGAQIGGSVSCPGAKVPAGGGAWIESGSVFASLNDSYPNGNAWYVDVNNNSGADTEFTVYAVCINRLPSYTVVQSPLATTSLGENDAAMDCPRGTKIIGGGAYSETSSTAVSLATSTPFALLSGHSGWEVFMTSSQATPTPYIVYSVCEAKPLTWSVQTGTTVTAPVGQQTEATVTCPTGYPLGGGGFNSFSGQDEGIALNVSYPVSNGWHIYENNAGTTSETATASVVCS